MSKPLTSGELFLAMAIHADAARQDSDEMRVAIWSRLLTVQTSDPDASEAVVAVQGMSPKAPGERDRHKIARVLGVNIEELEMRYNRGLQAYKEAPEEET